MSKYTLAYIHNTDSNTLQKYTILAQTLFKSIQYWLKHSKKYNIDSTTLKYSHWLDHSPQIHANTHINKHTDTQTYKLTYTQTHTHTYTYARVNVFILT